MNHSFYIKTPDKGGKALIEAVLELRPGCIKDDDELDAVLVCTIKQGAVSVNDRVKITDGNNILTTDEITHIELRRKGDTSHGAHRKINVLMSELRAAEYLALGIPPFKEVKTAS